MTIQIVYWPIRGTVQHILVMCEYLGIDYTFAPLDKSVDHPAWQVMKKENFPADWHFGNLPHLIDSEVPQHATHPLTECDALVAYIVQKSGNKDLIEANFTDMVDHQVVSGLLRDIKMGITMAAYMAPNPDGVKANLEGKSANFLNKLTGLAKRFEGGNWLFGEKLNVLDFFFAEMLECMAIQETDTGAIAISGIPALGEYVARFKALPAVKAYTEKQGYMQSPWNNYMAQWGSK
jgi:glutathione S-transferase